MLLPSVHAVLLWWRGWRMECQGYDLGIAGTFRLRLPRFEARPLAFRCGMYSLRFRRSPDGSATAIPYTVAPPLAATGRLSGRVRRRGGPSSVKSYFRKLPEVLAAMSPQVRIAFVAMIVLPPVGAFLLVLGEGSTRVIGAVLLGLCLVVPFGADVARAVREVRRHRRR